MGASEKTMRTCTSQSDVRYEQRTKRISGKLISYWEPVALVGEKRHKKPMKPAAKKEPATKKRTKKR